MIDRLRGWPSRGLSGAVTAPGDKSISHRALILAAMAEETSRIEGLLEADDVARTLAAIRAFGVSAERLGDGAWHVRGGAWRSPPGPIECGNSGTAARLLMGAVAGRPIAATFTGDPSLGRRPMRRVTGPLRAMGAGCEGGHTLPITVRGGRLRGLRWRNAHASAQVKSAVLLAGLGADGPVEVVEPWPSRDHTERMLGAFGVIVEREPWEDGVAVRLGGDRRLRATTIAVPGDFSSAAFPLVAALITPGSRVTVERVGVNPLRTGLLATLREMGADVALGNERMVGGEPVADVTARTSRLRGVTVPARRAPTMIDEYPVLAVAAAFADGATVMRGLAELRVKESDRLGAVAAGLAGCGVAVTAGDDALCVRGGAVAGGASVATRGDHRVAMAFLVLGLASAAPVSVDEAGMIATSFPGFAPLMRSLGARIEAA